MEKSFKLNIKNIKVLILVMVILFPFYVMGLVLMGSSIVNSQSPYGVLGGRIGARLSCNVIPCGSPPGLAIYVGPPGVGTSNPLSPGWVVVRPWTQIYEYGQLHSGAWVLGTMRPPSRCRYYTGRFCITIPSRGDVVIMGTSR